MSATPVRWGVSMEFPCHNASVWKLFQSTPEFSDLKLLVQNVIGDDDTSMWDIFVDGKRLTDRNTVATLTRKSAASTGGVVRRVALTVRRAEPWRATASLRTMRWPVRIVLSLSFLLFSAWAFAHWHGQTDEEGLDESLGRQASSDMAKIKAYEESLSLIKGWRRQASCDVIEMNATQWKGHEDSEDGLQDGRSSKQALREAIKFNGADCQAHDADLADGFNRQTSGLIEGRSRGASIEMAELDAINCTGYEAALLEEGRSREESSDMAELNATKGKVSEEGLTKGCKWQVASEVREMKRDDYDGGAQKMENGLPFSEAKLTDKIGHEAYEQRLKESNYSSCGGSRKASCAVGNSNATAEENITKKSLDKAKDAGSPEGPQRQSMFKQLLGYAYSSVLDWAWGFWFGLVLIVAEIDIMLVIGPSTTALYTHIVEDYDEATSPLWFALPALIAAKVLLWAFWVLACSLVFNVVQVFCSKGDPCFSIGMKIGLAACSTYTFLVMIVTATEKRWGEPLIAGVVGAVLSEMAWISLVEDVQEGQPVTTIASAILLAVYVWLWCWIGTFGQAWSERRPTIAAVVHLVLCTLLALCFVARFSAPFLFPSWKEDDLRLFALPCFPLFVASGAMALLNGFQAALAADAGAPLHTNDVVVTPACLPFLPMSHEPIFRCPDAWQRGMILFALTILLLSFVMRDRLKKPCW